MVLPHCRIRQALAVWFKKKRAHSHPVGSVDRHIGESRHGTPVTDGDVKGGFVLRLVDARESQSGASRLELRYSDPTDGSAKRKPKETPWWLHFAEAEISLSLTPADR